MSAPSTPPPASTLVVMTVIGPDQPGIVHRLATVIRAHGGNWLESRMSHLGGQFAGLVEARISTARLMAFEASLAALEDEGLQIVLRTSEPPPMLEVVDERLQIEILCPDRPGILHDLTRLLAERSVNVEELSSRIVAAQFSGELLFRARLRLSVEPSQSITDLRDAIEDLAAGLMIDVTMHRY